MNIEQSLNRGWKAHQARDFRGAEDVYRQVLAMDAANAKAWCFLGMACHDQARYEDAVAAYAQALHFEPEFPVALSNLGNTLTVMGRLDDAMASCEHALRLKPDYPTAHTNKAIILLSLGDFETGWKEYEWRWKLSGNAMPPFTQPLWDGSSLAGRTIFLHAEQGLGDTLQFVRYATLLKRSGARVILRCPKSLFSLLKDFNGADVVIDRGTPARFDVHAPLMSLPGICRTRLDNIPAEVPYLSADAALVATWRRELSHIDGFRVGIAWQGTPSNDKDKPRSTSLSRFAPLALIPGVRLINLQKGLGSEQIAAERARISLVDFGERLDAQAAFIDTAALMMNLDLVITVDTAIAHLAGALGVPVWIPLSFSPDWRWMQVRRDSPWYPAARLFRQPAMGDYETVFAEMAAALTALENESSKRGVASVSVRISPGELIDKITILEIKAERLSDPQKLANVLFELSELRDVYSRTIEPSPMLDKLVSELKSVNMALWQIEDEIRECERRQEFGARFIGLARSVYCQNDRRAAVKRQVNERLGAQIIEEKSYAAH